MHSRHISRHPSLCASFRHPRFIRRRDPWIIANASQSVTIITREPTYDDGGQRDLQFANVTLCISDSSSHRIAAQLANVYVLHAICCRALNDEEHESSWIDLAGTSERVVYSVKIGNAGKWFDSDGISTLAFAKRITTSNTTDGVHSEFVTYYYSVGSGCLPFSGKWTCTFPGCPFCGSANLYDLSSSDLTNWLHCSSTPPPVVRVSFRCARINNTIWCDRIGKFDIPDWRALGLHSPEVIIVVRLICFIENHSDLQFKSDYWRLVSYCSRSNGLHLNKGERGEETKTEWGNIPTLNGRQTQ